MNVNNFKIKWYSNAGFRLITWLEKKLIILQIIIKSQNEHVHLRIKINMVLFLNLFLHNYLWNKIDKSVIIIMIMLIIKYVPCICFPNLTHYNSFDSPKFEFILFLLHHLVIYRSVSRFRKSSNARWFYLRWFEKS